MQDFTLYMPTKYIFGKTAFSHLHNEAKRFGNKVLVVYGSGSIKSNGVYERVIKELAGFEIKEFSGIEPNPRIETLRKGIEIAKGFMPDLILAVGGGSVIDGAKLIAAAINYSGDAWEIIEKKPPLTWNIIPLATVLTISATGSEMNGASVVTNWSKHVKDYFSGNEIKPVFSLVDPTIQFSLPKEQIAYGVADAFSHVLEQYINNTTDAPLQDRFSEGILLTLIENGKKAVSEIENYDARANIVLCATMALNDLIGMGVTQDWTTHQIEHVVSAYYDIPHGAGLAIITSRFMKSVTSRIKVDKLVQYGKRVWMLTGTNEEIMDQAINKTYEFFDSLGIKMSLTDWGIEKEESFEKLIDACYKFEEMGDPHLTEAEIREILSNCY